MSNSSPEDVLLSLRERIPGMFCIPGCNSCCAHVPWSKIEWDMLPDEFKKIHTIHSLKCPFATDTGCSCHEHRPIICRLFGVTEGMECPRGGIAEIKLTEREAVEISKLYEQLFKE